MDSKSIWALLLPLRKLASLGPLLLLGHVSFVFGGFLLSSFCPESLLSCGILVLPWCKASGPLAAAKHAGCRSTAPCYDIELVLKMREVVSEGGVYVCAVWRLTRLTCCDVP